MISLVDYNKKVSDFFIDEFHRFQKQYLNPSSMGIYCNPKGGWISFHFNVNKSLSETSNNCLDFEFVEFAMLDMPEWKTEYETDHPSWKGLYDEIYRYNSRQGDEGVNSLFFNYLKRMYKLVQEKAKIPNTLIQILDSIYKEVM
jgi:hypothetical protein